MIENTNNFSHSLKTTEHGVNIAGLLWQKVPQWPTDNEQQYIFFHDDGTSACFVFFIFIVQDNDLLCHAAT